MRTRLSLVLCALLPALAARPACGSDPKVRPMIGLPRPPEEQANLGWLYPDLDPAFAALAANPAPRPRRARFAQTGTPGTRDGALARAQATPDAPSPTEPMLAGRPPGTAIGAGVPGLPPAGMAGPFPPPPGSTPSDAPSRTPGSDGRPPRMPTPIAPPGAEMLNLPPSGAAGTFPPRPPQP